MKAALFDHDGRFLQTINGPLEHVILPTARAMGVRFAVGEYDETYHLTPQGPQKLPDVPVTPDATALRAKSYPPTGDQLDALLKFVQAMQEQGVELPPETQAWVDQCQQVKQTYPSPSESDHE